MKNHLLSIFPVHGEDIYARVSCTTLVEITFKCAKPFTLNSPTCLRKRLRAFLTEDATDDILILIEAGEIVHRLISDKDARSLGFLPVLQ
ncbi:hypothetical protein [Terriglobus roseus]|uniref:Uncharacterized protein n=1 Tax=Terriglobus roseus TaxID=392734 RepID=A0A1H4K1K6_9BACT|nr:hypothetical protein [Terriglobus roseus]SEB52176.1 hypothetical protein SAMN05443244_0941 [Terriglobus roseus]